jgi:hypothetical protein
MTVAANLQSMSLVEAKQGGKATGLLFSDKQNLSQIVAETMLSQSDFSRNVGMPNDHDAVIKQDQVVFVEKARTSGRANNPG